MAARVRGRVPRVSRGDLPTYGAPPRKPLRLRGHRLLALGGRRAARVPRRLQWPDAHADPDRPGLHPARAPQARLRDDPGCRPELLAARARPSRVLPLHGPRESDVQPDLRGDRVRAGVRRDGVQLPGGGLRLPRGTLLQVADDLAGGVRSRGAGYAAPGMCARATQVQTADAEPVPRAAEQRPPDEELIQTGFAVVDVAAGQAVLGLQVDRRGHPSRGDEVREAGRVPLYRLHDEG